MEKNGYRVVIGRKPYLVTTAFKVKQRMGADRFVKAGTHQEQTESELRRAGWAWTPDAAMKLAIEHQKGEVEAARVAFDDATRWHQALGAALAKGQLDMRDEHDIRADGFTTVVISRAV